MRCPAEAEKDPRLPLSAELLYARWMPLFIDSGAPFDAASFGKRTYGDSTQTGGAWLDRKYILAQFRDDSDLQWVPQLREKLRTDELKHSKLRHEEESLQGSDPTFWRRVKRGVGQATIIVIDPEPVRERIEDLRLVDPANPEADRIVTTHAATAILEDTPIAYLPMNLVRLMPDDLRYAPLSSHDGGTEANTGSLAQFAPQELLARLGGGLRQTKIFAARAHALFDLASMDESAVRTTDAFRGALYRPLMLELLSTCRVFDTESDTATSLLNEAVDTIASNVLQSVQLLAAAARGDLVREEESRRRDALQAADVAAGWARDVIRRGEIANLGDQFERVWVNGVRIK